MSCCDVRVTLLVFVVLMGCDNPSSSRSTSKRPPLVSMHPTGDFAGPASYHWDHRGKDTACRIALPNRTAMPVTLRFRQIEIDSNPVGIIFLDSAYAIEVGKIFSDQMVIFVRPGDVIPYHDQLYHVTFDSDSLVIKCVTDLVPTHFHPDPRHLIIAQSEPPEIRQRLYLLYKDDWSDYERVRVTQIADDGSYAEYEGKPYYGSGQGAFGGKTIEPQEVVHQWANSTTDVAGIVPSVEIDGVGRLRGWVEFRQTLVDN
ncbi:hypothetical protein [Bremerella alba]|uniref:Uncharacterized protein n=1 Tax=Bremerella alba TaxID=980252 RepID=A0A7V8V9M3_9BACT|nr:hypothetical protein [Bremerella alba]MBA2117435.1 hypothetical protein [Bremerella alba]